MRLTFNSINPLFNVSTLTGAGLAALSERDYVVGTAEAEMIVSFRNSW